MRPSAPELSQVVVRRLLHAVPLLLTSLGVAFALIHLAPGDPLYLLAGDGGNAAYYQEMRERYALDRPLAEQFFRYVGAAVSGNFGYSFRYQAPVVTVILDRLPATLLLALTALMGASFLGVGMGILASLRAHSLVDRGMRLLTSTVYAMPVFWVGQILILLLAGGAGLFPVGGYSSARESYEGLRHLADVAHHLFLPALTLSLSFLAVTARVTRARLLEATQEPYMVTARAKGHSHLHAVTRHAFPNALVPVVTLIGYRTGALLTGAALTEALFAWPGLGHLLLEASLARDYPLVTAIFLMVSVMVIAANLATDLLYVVIDPRVLET